VVTAELERDIPANSLILIDTTLLAAYLDATEATHGVARLVMSRLVATGRNRAIVSMVTVMELLVRPLRQSPPGTFAVLDFLRNHPNLAVPNLDLQMAQEAARLRAENRLRPPDALVVGTGIACQVSHLVTNDRAWEAKLASVSPRLKVVVIDRYVHPTVAPRGPAGTGR